MTICTVKKGEKNTNLGIWKMLKVFEFIRHNIPITFPQIFHIAAPDLLHKERERKKVMTFR